MPGTKRQLKPNAPIVPIFSSTALAMAASSNESSAALLRKTALDESKASAIAMKAIR